MIPTKMRLITSAISVLALALVVFGGPIYEVFHRNWPGATLVDEITFESVRSGETSKALEKALAKNTYLDDLARPRYNELRYLVLNETNTGVVVGKDGWLFPSQRLASVGKKNEDEFERSVAAIQGLSSHLQEKGCHLIIELVPRKQTLYPEMLPENLDPPYKPYFDLVFNSLRDAGLDVPDLRDCLRPQDKLLYFTNDNHWTAEGCHAAARVISERIISLYPNSTPPGTPMDVKFHRLKPLDFIGTQQRALGFWEGGLLYNSFMDQYTPVLAVDESNVKAHRRGAKTPQPILLIGTSMSQNRFANTSQLIGFLGVDVEDHARNGYGAGYRVVDIFRNLVTSRRPYPEVIVWEFPEDFPIREGRYFSQPLEAIISILDGAPYKVEPLECESASLDGVSVLGESEGLLLARARDKTSSLTFELPEPLKEGQRAAVHFEITPTKNGRYRGNVVVEWGGGESFKAQGSKSCIVGRSKWLHPIVVPLVASEGETITHVRIHPYSSKTDFKFGNVELWTQ